MVIPFLDQVYPHGRDKGHVLSGLHEGVTMPI